MKTSRQAQDTIPGHVEVELVGITTPAAKQLNLEVSVPGNGSCRSSATPETVARVAGLVKTDGGNAGLESADKFGTAKRGRISFCKEWGSGREGMDGEEVLHCADRTSGWGIWRSGNDNGDAAAERVGLGGWDSELHVFDTTILEEPNRVPRKVDSAIKPGAITNGELPTSEETRPSQILGRVKDGVVNVRKITSDESETEEDVKSNGELGLAIPITLKSLDPPNHTLQRRGVADLERKARVDMEGTNGREVAFNGLVENGTILACEMSCPGHESKLGGWEELAGSESMLGVEPDEIKE
jgi:hypothetical protein